MHIQRFGLIGVVCLWLPAFSAMAAPEGLSPDAIATWNQAVGDAAHVTLLVFALAVVAILTGAFLIKFTEYSWTPYSVIRLMGLILILMITLMLTVVPVVDQETLTQVIGLLGAIGGYLLGKDPREMDINRTEQRKSTSKDTPSDTTASTPERPAPFSSDAPSSDRPDNAP